MLYYAKGLSAKILLLLLFYTSDIGQEEFNLRLRVHARNYLRYKLGVQENQIEGINFFEKKILLNYFLIHCIDYS